ncbi:tRNA pseudouridine(38-40) synthase TruA [Acidipila sp. EB88]|uniref:tRNA pseudouridine(38-40) synthase TruA n=1 Tax=Acidipila sp. EB88 TaxID=2305226 RepID=UPI000F5E3BEB|nr:tRNA pseudouridine(38-40) synthase TruA [Acidipila sp. EB88]RRA49520.1 tRNA pseudouridine(38-40) synthase TruA [Acidipila sp. EB88]
MSHASPPSTWKLTLSFDGSPFAGWQVQPGRRTIQGELVKALARVTGERTLPQGSGRTDAGVHALAHVASVSLQSPIPAHSLRRALNNVLPAAIRVTAAELALPGFHARHSAVRKTYEYRVFRGNLCPPWLAPYVLPYTFRLRFEALQRAASLVLGTHDFRSFQSHEPDLSTRVEAGGRPAPPTTRTMHESFWEQPAPDLLVYRVTGSGFLHHMVRNLVGTFLDAGRSRIDPESIPGMLAECSRSAAGPTAPASGLWLHSVEYPAGSLLAGQQAAPAPGATLGYTPVP